VYNVGGGHRTSLNRALDVLARIVGRPLDVRRGKRESGDVQDTGADTTRARRELGFDPRTALEEGLAAELDWVRERAHGAPRLRTLTASGRSPPPAWREASDIGGVPRFQSHSRPEHLVASVVVLADQTNQLALDTAVEAARADSLGKLTVVVEQVCRLAI